MHINDILKSPKLEAIKARFLSKVNKADGCWIWTGYRNKKGYGVFGAISRRTELAHRVSFVIHNGPIPAELCVLHTCDNPPCVNPDHFFTGTQSDNAADKIEKGRQKGGVGTRNSHSVLTEHQVLAIRQDHRMQKRIANEYGVSQSTISSVIRRATWAHI